jgi:polyketide synthase PksN
MTASDVHTATGAGLTAPRWVNRDDADFHAAERAVQDLVARYGRDLSVAVARTSLAPHFFLSSGEQSVFFVNRRNRSLFAFAYAGPDRCFAESARELFAYAEREKLVANVLEEEPRARALAALGYTATPYGVMQKVPDLTAFSLEGTRMRRLRYQINHYEKCGRCETGEYRVGSVPQTDGALAALIDQWIAGKKQTGTYVERFRRDIVAGALPAHCRLFLTHRDGRLDNAIVISRLAALNGYLMDLEFYAEDMPLGGLEFAIPKIQDIVAAEGASYFSLGATFGTRLEACAEEDVRVARTLRGFHAARIFNDDGNFQFKNKFRPENTRVYLCRPAAAPAATIADVLSIFADPENRRQARAAAPAA